MSDEGEWRVVLHNDPINTFSGVAYALIEACGLTIDDAKQAAVTVHQRGRAEVCTHSAAQPAEQQVAALHVLGIDATVERG